MRHDFYGTIHKAIRRELLGLVVDAATAGGDAAAWVALSERLERAAFILAEHAKHEERFVHPLLAERATDVATRLDADHAALDGHLARVLRIFAVNAALDRHASADERAAAHAALTSFVAAYLGHMDVEESLAMPALWRTQTDETLVAAHRNLVSSIGADAMPAFLSAMLPAISLEERVELLAGVRASVPAPVFDGVTSLARSVLPAGSFDATWAALGQGRPE